MKELLNPDLYLVLMHDNVIDKKGKSITSSVTNLDLHDMARAGRTYGVKKFYVVTPLGDQQALVEQIISHWTTGVGGHINPARKEALELVTVKSSMAQVKDDIFEREQKDVKTVVTTARDRPGSTSFAAFRDMLSGDDPFVLIFGTAWGLSETFLAEADHVLEPIPGCTDYNHLSVRSATSIVLDRSLGNR